MSNLTKQLEALHNKYRRIFLEYAVFLKNEIEKLRPKEVCGEIFDKYEKNSAGRVWQKNTYNYIENIIRNEIPKEIKSVKIMREKYFCNGCGMCCRFACSEFSPDELKNKTLNDDKFAKEFTETFVPYETKKEAAKIFPQYVDFLKTQDENGYYFYHCPKVTKDNRCPDYEKRPRICRDFPDNPLAFLPPMCGFNGWKEKAEPIMLKINAMSEILNFYKNRL